jgi:hypothetical protein
MDTFPVFVYSQEKESNQFEDQSKFSLTFYLATTWGGPEGDIENQGRFR